MQEKLPRVMHIDGKCSSHLINRNRLRKLIHKKYDSINHSLPLPDIALHQLIAMSVHNLTVLPKKKALCEVIQREPQIAHPSARNKKVLIFNQRPFEVKDNEIADLKTCKSLLNPKVGTAKRVMTLFSSKKQPSRYANQSIQSLWDITDRNATEPLKLPKNEDF